MGVTMGKIIRLDELHRLVKLALDTGEASTVEEAERLFGDYRLAIAVGRDVATSPTLQAALLTAVHTGRRRFLGGLSVAGALDMPLRVPWHGCRTLAEAVIDLQGNAVAALDPEVPRIVIGDADMGASGEFAMRATFEGWAGGIVPL